VSELELLGSVRLPLSVLKLQKQIMNEHYLFDMCSATT